MNRWTHKLVDHWVSLGPRYLPFADVATPDLPLSKLMRLSLFQISVGMTMVLLVGTLNRVMIVELGVSATMVGIMVALPLMVAPFRAIIGHSSDHHRSELGWRRVPFIWKGTVWQFGGFAFMPFALLVLAKQGDSQFIPAWTGVAAAAAAFLLVGGGAHTVQTAGLALATDLTPTESHPRVVGLMYVTLLLGMIGSALVFGIALADYSPKRLVQVIQSVAVLSVLLNFAAMWRMESRRPRRDRPQRERDPTFRESWAVFCSGENTLRRLTLVGIGTVGFGMADVLLEPFGGHVLQMNVASTTKLTALLALGGLLGFAYASRALARGGDAYRVSIAGALLGIPGFGLVMAAAPMGLPWVFVAGNFLIGFGGALFGHGTLTATMERAPKDQVGLAIGAWGAVQATAAGVAMLLSGILRDIASAAWGLGDSAGSLAGGYLSVYVLEIAFLLVAVIVSLPLLRKLPRREVLAHG